MTVCHRCEDLKKVAELQRDDEGLSLKPQTAPEAYLQQALAGLHTMIQRPEANPLRTMMLIGGEDEFRFYFRVVEEVTQAEIMKAIGAIEVFKSSLLAMMNRTPLTTEDLGGASHSN